MKKLLTVTAIMMSMGVQAEVLDMVEHATDAKGNTWSIERKFYDFGNRANGYKYKGTRVWIQKPDGSHHVDGELYFDCSDATYGFYTPTTEDIMSGTMIHGLYLKACKE